MEIVYRPLADLKPNPKNPRKGSSEAIAKLADSIKNNPKFFEARPILLSDRTGELVIIGGERRSEAAALLKMKTVPTILFSGLTEAEEDEILIKDNTHAGTWDIEKLRKIAQEWGGEGTLKKWDVDLKPGWSIGKEYAEKLAVRFVAPPFSVLETTAGDWQKRKLSWELKMGNSSSATRENTLSSSGNLLSSINAGTSNFDPVLAETMIKWFCPIDGRIVDPFAGEPVKGFIAGSLGRDYVGIDIRPEQIRVNKEVCRDFKRVNFIAADSRNIAGEISERGDFCITSPPYYNLEIYSNDKSDASNAQSYTDFRAMMFEIWSGVYKVLKDDAFLVVKVGEVRDKKTGIYVNFVGDTIADLCAIGFNYYNEIILVNAVGTAALRANSSMRSRKVVKRHQNVLVFFKGRLENILPRLENVEVSSAENSGEKIGLEERFLPIYEAFAGEQKPHILSDVDAGLTDFLRVASAGETEIASVVNYPQLTIQENKKCLVSFTGGKDSTCAALVLRDGGFDVTLAFITGLNKAFPEEKQRAEKLAGILDFPIVMLEAPAKIKNVHPDNPVKNQLILSMLADYAVEHGYSNISTGVIPVPNPNYEYDWSDGAAQMQTYIEYLENSVHGLRYVEVMSGRNEAANLEYLFGLHNATEIINNLSSCVGAHRYRKLWREQILAKYGVNLADNRCGRCFKCAYQFILESLLFGVQNEEYLKYCFGVFKKNAGMMHSNASGEDMLEALQINFGKERGDKIYEIYKRL